MSSSNGKKGSKKIGRSARRPAHTRYNNAKQWKINKQKKIEKEAKRQAKLKAKKLKNIIQ